MDRSSFVESQLDRKGFADIWVRSNDAVVFVDAVLKLNLITTNKL